jgi:hypothetical protein
MSNSTEENAKENKDRDVYISDSELAVYLNEIWRTLELSTFRSEYIDSILLSKDKCI